MAIVLKTIRGKISRGFESSIFRQKTMTSDYWKKLYYKKKNEAIQKLGGKCVKCGEEENLEFDHIDPATKKFSITNLIRQNITGELAKCQLLCKKCHQDKTGRTSHGKRRMYNNGCRCDKCSEANRVYSREYQRHIRQVV